MIEQVDGLKVFQFHPAPTRSLPPANELLELTTLSINTTHTHISMMS